MIKIVRKSGDFFSSSNRAELSRLKGMIWIYFILFHIKRGDNICLFLGRFYDIYYHYLIRSGTMIFLVQQLSHSESFCQVQVAICSSSLLFHSGLENSPNSQKWNQGRQKLIWTLKQKSLRSIIPRSVINFREHFDFLMNNAFQIRFTSLKFLSLSFYFLQFMI